MHQQTYQFHQLIDSYYAKRYVLRNQDKKSIFDYQIIDAKSCIRRVRLIEKIGIEVGYFDARYFFGSKISGL